MCIFTRILRTASAAASRIRPFLQRYADFDFSIDYERWSIRFFRPVEGDVGTEIIDNIKVSRSEENIFISCFFLAVIQLSIDKALPYQWVQYIYIDNPISSLDEHNAIAVANHLAQMLKQDSDLKTVFSTHHTLFFNVLCNELSNARKHFLSRDKRANGGDSGEE